MCHVVPRAEFDKFKNDYYKQHEELLTLSQKMAWFESQMDIGVFRKPPPWMSQQQPPFGGPKGSFVTGRSSCNLPYAHENKQYRPQ